MIGVNLILLGTGVDGLKVCFGGVFGVESDELLLGGLGVAG